MNLSPEQQAIREIHNTMHLMDWIEARGLDPEDVNNFTDVKVESARRWLLRNGHTL